MIFAIAMITAVAASAQTPFFKKCEDAKGITTVLVTKAMLKMAGKMGGNAQMDSFAKSLVGEKLDCVEVITSDNAEGFKFLSKQIKMFDKKNGYNMLMKVNDDGDDVKILSSDLGDGKSRYVVIAAEPSEMSVIIMEGTLTLEDVTRCTKK